MYKGKIDATEKTDKADDYASETTSHKATKGDKSATSSKGKGKQTNDGEEEKGKPKDLDKAADEVGEGSETKTTKNGNDPEIETEFQSILKRSPVIVFSKSYCPFSRKAKHILSKYTIVPAPHIVELDEHPLGGRLQVMIGKITGRATVPNILINGKSLGGGDDVEALHQKGTLAQSIRDMAGKRVVQVSSKAKRSAVDDNTL
ncbi:hypothetical protein KEM56_003497 [Ascosphaera pollenicola]|nr:hypothetical protein KEM56_003497 [Ascosphaera pollenicola]